MLALLAAWALPGTSRLSGAIDPIVALMLFATFLQVPMVELRHALRDLRFLGVLGLANFVAVPLLVAGLVPWMPADPLIRSAMLMVLLAPCIDYVVTFAHLGRADARALLAATPLLLGAQMVLLPVYLSVFIGAQAAPLLPWEPFLSAFFRLIVAPLVLAALCQAWMARAGSHPKVRRALGFCRCRRRRWRWLSWLLPSRPGWGWTSSGPRPLFTWLSPCWRLHWGGWWLIICLALSVGPSHSARPPATHWWFYPSGWRSPGRSL
ncbi:sodium Bile acid symporter family protein [Bordetella holmesii 44057]|nr:sodium Bile acid symporter family protein [Bordetella holmesii 44057]